MSKTWPPPPLRKDLGACKRKSPPGKSWEVTSQGRRQANYLSGGRPTVYMYVSKTVSNRYWHLNYTGAHFSQWWVLQLFFSSLTFRSTPPLCLEGVVEQTKLPLPKKRACFQGTVQTQRACAVLLQPAKRARTLHDTNVIFHIAAFRGQPKSEFRHLETFACFAASAHGNNCHSKHFNLYLVKKGRIRIWRRNHVAFHQNRLEKKKKKSHKGKKLYITTFSAILQMVKISWKSKWLWDTFFLVKGVRNNTKREAATENAVCVWWWFLLANETNTKGSFISQPLIWPFF